MANPSPKPELLKLDYPPPTGARPGEAPPGFAEKWIEAQLIEAHEFVAVVALARSDGTVTLTIHRPAYPVPLSKLELPAKVLVRALVQPPTQAVALIQGQAVHVEL